MYRVMSHDFFKIEREPNYTLWHLLVFSAKVAVYITYFWVLDKKEGTLRLGFPDGTVVQKLPAHARDMGLEDPLEKEIATHSSILACETPRAEESGKLQSMGPQRVFMSFGKEGALRLTDSKQMCFSG